MPRDALEEDFSEDCEYAPETRQEWDTLCTSLGSVPIPNMTSRVLTKPRSSTLIGFDGGFKVQINQVTCEWFSWIGFNAWVNKNIIKN
jgi:hypothetical protein